VEIKILGTGCPKCIATEKVVREALSDLKMDVTVEKVTSVDEIVELGVMLTPAVAIDGAIMFGGRVPKKEEVIKVLSSLKR